ncbi:hypothetical protein LYNGBM3L_23800 [Moorena producens 3L]|uniref:Uncharacterized protein n=1 Tax=Moorena producens 3L TaxID=489825 RepID=F4XNA7_9CYAN|nr:hypothetical protein LYNGBM3L_23800 [Moorena producens 3L]
MAGLKLAGWQVDGIPELRNDIKYSWVSYQLPITNY